MKRLLLLSTVFFILLFFACEEPADLILPEFQPEIVASCNFSPDSNFIAFVSISKSILDETPTYSYPTNALVELYCDGVLLTILDSLIYDQDLAIRPFYTKFGIKPIAGKTYSLRISIPSVPTITPIIAEGFAPTSLPNISSYLENLTIQTDTNSPTTTKIYNLLLHVDIEDPSNIENYYHLQHIFIQYRDFDPNMGDTIVYAPRRLPITSYIYLFPDDPSLTYHFDNTANQNSLIFNDETFEGSTKQLTYECNFSLNTQNIFIDGLVVELRSTSEDYYLYHESLSRQNKVSSDQLAEPVLLYNNIQNGKGNFAGYNKVFDVVPLYP